MIYSNYFLIRQTFKTLLNNVMTEFINDHLIQTSKNNSFFYISIMTFSIILWLCPYYSSFIPVWFCLKILLCFPNNSFFLFFFIIMMFFLKHYKLLPIFFFNHISFVFFLVLTVALILRCINSTISTTMANTFSQYLQISTAFVRDTQLTTCPW